jgi:hypothetical protein
LRSWFSRNSIVQRSLSFSDSVFTDLPASATLRPCWAASIVAWSISEAPAVTEAMKLDAWVAFSVSVCVVVPCSRTAPLTLSNTGRIASIDCEMRCIESIESAASRCSASILRAISSVACWVCTARAFTSEATTAKPRPASPARAASMVELSASSVVCRAIEAIRLTTLPMACDDCRRRSTPSLAELAAALA